MPTLKPINSSLLTVWTSANGTTWTAIAECNDASISFSHATRDVTTKSSGGFKATLEGLREASISGSGLYAYDSVNGPDTLFTTYLNRTQVWIRLSTEVTGDKTYKAQAYITSLELASPSSEDTATYSVEFEVTGAFTQETNV
jgi:TP901-1 family phage major tail protein